MSNKDEALRAKDLAEDCMRKSDFTTARRVAIKAQKMDGNLENISQMIMVCDVHCASLEKFGDESDWYKILQVDQNADDNAIKKQYRKLALHLHPDKNKLPGAESAFKTIGEAQRILLDTHKRRTHDMKRKPFRRPIPSYQPRQPSPATGWGFHTQPVFQPGVNPARNSFAAGLRPENQQRPQAQPSGFSGGLKFMTSCTFCCMSREYPREFINKVTICPRCDQKFVASETTFQGPTSQATFPFVQQSRVSTQEAGKAAEKQPENSVKISPRKEGYRTKSSGSSAEKINGKRKRKNIFESSESSSSKSSFEWEEVVTGGQHSRRSVRSKQHVSYQENVSDDEDKEVDAENADFGKKVQENVFAETLPNGINRKNKVKEKDSSSGSASDSEIFECADPEFSNFDKSREETCFKAGQIWAMYDDKGPMPRYYAMIRKVIKKPSFMLKMTWLEARPDDEKTKQWVRKKLPISTGKFELCGDGNTNKTSMFSHLIYCSVRGLKDTIGVYPRKGETWALFKNWDINWSSARRHRVYEYEFVEILSEYAEGVAIEVAILRKVKGFASVFCRITPGGGSGTVQIPPNELLRFSHSIPSTKLTGKEANGIPVGSFELDTAALPQKIEEEEEVAIPVLREAAKSNQVHHPSPPSSEPDCVVIPGHQFHDFNFERSEGKFAKGQIWSLNSEEDGLPKHYVKIQKTEWKPVFKLQIRRLQLESLPPNVTHWVDKKMPVSCGNFTLKSQDEILTKVTGFSHEIKPQQDPRSNKYIVLPKTGEIWAMYKNWSDTIKPASLKKCEYEVAEVIDDNESYIEVMMLERVNGFFSVFKEKMEGGMDVKKKVPREQLLRFSHFVPAFRLTEEKDGALRGYVELDPKALPRNLRRSC